jgi:hypothetical protein
MARKRGEGPAWVDQEERRGKDAATRGHPRPVSGRYQRFIEREQGQQRLFPEETPSDEGGKSQMLIRCHVCHADPAGRWKQPPAMIFIDPYREDGKKYACRDHLSPEREDEIKARERERGLKEGALR